MRLGERVLVLLPQQVFAVERNKAKDFFFPLGTRGTVRTLVSFFCSNIRCRCPGLEMENAGNGLGPH